MLEKGSRDHHQLKTQLKAVELVLFEQSYEVVPIVNCLFKLMAAPSLAYQSDRQKNAGSLAQRTFQHLREKGPEENNGT